MAARVLRRTAMTLAELKDIYNAVEPFIWYVVAAVSVIALRRHAALGDRLLLATALVVFGTSDFFETVAWWTPWWLQRPCLRPTGHPASILRAAEWASGGLVQCEHSSQGRPRPIGP